LTPDRRSFLRQASAFTVLLRAARAMPMPMPAPAQPARMLHSLELPPFVDALPLPKRLQPIAPRRRGQPHTLRVAMREVQGKFHRDVPASRFWSYRSGDGTGDGMLAPVIEARAHQPLEIEWVNELPAHHFLPIDHTLHGCGADVPEVRAIVHVHGAKVLPKDDGYPDDWFVPGAGRRCLYPLQQDAAALWYHDHAMGLNRLNIYAGLFGMFLIRDAVEDGLHLPSGRYEIPLMLCDRDFTADGQLFYPDSGIPGHPWVPEFLADAILINGKLRPYCEVEPRIYRFRVLIAANSRFFALSLTDRAPFHQIGSDQGLLAAPAELTHLTIAPAERADLLIDFSKQAGRTIHLLNGAFEVLEFRVAGSPQVAMPLPAALRPVRRTPVSEAVVTRTITLNEYQDKVGNPMVMLLNRKHWHEPVTETPKLNLTEDVHPMHLHLVRFQLLDRRVFDSYAYLMYKQLKFQSDPQLPEPNEAGWKDTIQCPPGMITRIIARFEGYPGKYLYHCHILEHESNDMMRPFEVLA
jgi:spore coat protein A